MSNIPEPERAIEAVNDDPQAVALLCVYDLVEAYLDLRDSTHVWKRVCKRLLEATDPGAGGMDILFPIVVGRWAIFPPDCPGGDFTVKEVTRLTADPPAQAPGA